MPVRFCVWKKQVNPGNFKTYTYAGMSMRHGSVGSEVLLVEDELGVGLAREVVREAAQLGRHLLVAAVEDADAAALVRARHALEHLPPVGAREVRAHARAGHHVDAALGVVQRLQHHQQRGPRVALLVHAGAVVVQLHDVPPGVALRHLVHHAAEPLEGALLARAPVEVDAPRHECRRPRRRRRGGFLDVGDVVQHVLDDADQRGGADAQPDEEEHVVLAVVLRRRAVGAVDQQLREAAGGGGARRRRDGRREVRADEPALPVRRRAAHLREERAEARGPVAAAPDVHAQVVVPRRRGDGERVPAPFIHLLSINNSWFVQRSV
jgi:hypothetical protein